MRAEMGCTWIMWAIKTARCGPDGFLNVWTSFDLAGELYYPLTTFTKSENEVPPTGGELRLIELIGAGDKQKLLVVIKGQCALQMKCSFSICCEMKTAKWQMERTVWGWGPQYPLVVIMHTEKSMSQPFNSWNITKLISIISLYELFQNLKPF